MNTENRVQLVPWGLRDEMLEALRVVQATFSRLSNEDKTIYPKIKKAWDLTCITIAKVEE